MGQIETTLLNGFRFRCRDGCALCCFTTPAVDREEQRAILQIAPTAPIVGDGPEYRFVASRPSGGACHLLAGLRCTVHAVRPFPCRTYPLTVHLGYQAQASVVLACPGLDLSALASFDGSPRRDPVLGLDDELSRAESELARPPARGRLVQANDRMRRGAQRLDSQGRWEDPERLRSAVRESTLVDLSEFPAPAPSLEADDVATLPLTFDPEYGRVAFGGEGNTWEIWHLSETGTETVVLGTYALSAERPRLTPEANQILHGYLRYVAHRDSLVGQLVHAVLRDGGISFGDAFRAELRAIGVDVVTRAVLLATLHGRSPFELDSGAVEAGIRATDSELLDRPTEGAVL